MRHVRFAFLLLFALAAAAACSASGSAGTAAAGPRTSLNGPITLDEITASPATNALDLVRSLRPQWLRPRGTSRVGQGADPVVVYLNNLRMGDVNQLRELSTSQVQSVEYLDSRRAQLRFGNGHEAGVLVVVSRS